jgi:hypothetical protein
MAVEEPDFQTVLSEQPFEIRDYPALVVAETIAGGAQWPAANEGFRRLAGYIFGANRRRRKIAMTAPVGQTQSADAWVVRFTMPGGCTLETLPEPDDARVILRETPPVRVAVLRFSGWARADDVAGKMATLRAWVRRKQLTPSGPVSLAQYNPPWTLGFWRRNEVMMPLERQEAHSHSIVPGGLEVTS